MEQPSTPRNGRTNHHTGNGRTNDRCHVGLNKILNLLSGEIRLEILKNLACGERDVTSLAEDLGREVPQVSLNLRSLRECGLVEVEQIKRRRVYRLGRHVQIKPNGAGRTGGEDGYDLRINCLEGDWVEVVVSARKPRVPPPPNR